MKRSIQAIEESVGKTIEWARLADDILRIQFTDGATLDIWDQEQQCCEKRYMRTDDDLAFYDGAILLGVVVNAAQEPTPQHEIQFMDVKTNKGVFTFSAHNEHNGFYDGFEITAKLYKAPEKK